MASPSRPRVMDEWLFGLASLWFIGGLFLDGWAHNHIPELETFFTLWHAAFYSGFGAVVAALAWMIYRSKKKGQSWKSAIPIGYVQSVAGACIFLIGGVGDMLWHEIFGIESDIEALLSPTHLVLATGATLILSGPLLSWWQRKRVERSGGLLSQLPMLISVTLLLSLFAFMTQYAHFVDMAPIQPDENVGRAIAGFLLQSVILMGCILLIMRHGRLAFGALTVIITINMIGMGFMRDGQILIPGAFVAGMIGDGLLQHLYKTGMRARDLRLFSLLLPAILFLAYYLSLFTVSPVWWSVHLWTGSIFLAGISSLLLSFIAVPPPSPDPS